MTKNNKNSIKMIEDYLRKLEDTKGLKEVDGTTYFNPNIIEKKEKENFYNLGKEYEKIEEANKVLKREMNKLKKKVKQLETQKAELSKTNKKQKKEIKDLENVMKKLEKFKRFDIMDI